MIKVAIYCRLSEEDKNKKEQDSESIQNQKSMLISYAIEKQWKIYKIYSDDDYAGADRSRPEFNKLLNDAKLHRFDIVLCKTQSRFTRELELVEKYIHGFFPLWGIRFVSIVDNADTEIKGNKKSRQITGLVNEWYLEDMSENIKSVLTDKRKRGMHIGSFALYGYNKDLNNKGRLIIDEKAARIVQEIFTLFCKGYGKTSIARILNERGEPNPTAYKKLQGLKYKQSSDSKSTLWRYSTIDSILKNEMYIGNMVQGKYKSASYKMKKNISVPKQNWIRYEHTHEAIIEIDLWKKTQLLIKEKYKPFADGKIGLFAGKVRCMNCGYIMKSCKSNGRYYLKCPTHYIDKKSCIGAFISLEKLKNTVICELKKLLDTYVHEEDLVRINNGEIDNTELTSYLNKKKTYKKAIKDLYLDKSKGIISQQDYLEMYTDFSKQICMIDNMIEELQKVYQQDMNLESLFDTYIRNIDRAVIDTFIDVIYISDKKDNMIDVEIHWSF